VRTNRAKKTLPTTIPCTVLLGVLKGLDVKIHQVVLTFIDFDQIGADGAKDTIENANYPNDCMYPHVRSVETRDIGEWADDHPLNNTVTAEAEMKRLFG